MTSHDATSLVGKPRAAGESAPASRRPREKTIGAGLDRIVSEYLAAWNADNEVLRRRHLHATWNEDGTFEDPLTRLEGPEAMGTYIAACRTARPGIRWSVTGEIAHHHGRILFSWEAHDGLRREIVRGSSFGELDGQGRIRRIVGFFA